MASIPLSSWDNNHPYTVADLLQTYERTYLPQLAPTTQIHHRVVFRSLCRPYGGLPLAAITPAWRRQGRAEISPTHTRGTVRQCLATLSGARSRAAERRRPCEQPVGRVLSRA